MTRSTKVASLLFLLLLFSVTLVAQLNLATLVGTVKDTSGAVVPGAKVTLKNQETGSVRTATTDASGDYTLASLEVGRYSLVVSMGGFKTTTIPEVQLQVGQSARIDVVLQVGSATQEVTVTTAAPLISTTTSDVGQVVDRGVLNNIPLNGRAFWQLTQLTPGANYTPGGQNPYSGTNAIRARAVNVTINAGDTMKTGWTLDGSSILEVQAGGTAVQPTVDAIQEFKVESGNMSAEFGRTPTVVTATIKSGTNQFHGDLFEFVRNDHFDARNFFFHAPVGSAITKDVLKRNQFGGTIGGPIKRDKTFFFGDFEETRTRQSVVYSNVVPSLAMRQGDFSELLPRTQLQNPLNGYQDFANNQVPSTLFSPQARFFLNYLPQANFLQGTTSRAVFGNRLWLNTSKSDIKLDEHLNARDHLMGRYSIADNTQGLPDQFPALGILDNHSRGQDFAMVYTHIFNPSWLNEARIGYYRMLFFFQPPLGSTYFNQASLANYQGFDLQSYGGFPQINLSGYTGFDGAPSNQLPKSNHIRTFEYADAVTYNRGKHNIKMGFQLYHNSTGYITGSQTQGIFNFVGTYTGNAFADFLLGVPDNVSRDPGAPWWGNYGNWPAVFFHDNYRVTENLTLNLGLRYEYNPFYTGQRGQMSGLNLATGQLIIPSNFDVTARPISALLVPLYQDRFVYTNSLGLPNSIIIASKKDLGPRIGFAWKPFGKDKWALRAGYGVFYAYPDNNAPNNTVGVPPNTAADQQFNDRRPRAPTRNWANFFLGVPLVGLPNPNPGQPCSLLGFTAVSCSAPALSTGIFGAQRMTYVQEWNFTLQHEIRSALSLTVAYVGNNTVHNMLSQSVNNPPPGTGNIQPRRPLKQWSTIGQYQYGGIANYNALQVSAVSRSWRGLSLLGNYTYSKCIDDGSNESGAPTYALTSFNRAVCDLDRTHSSAISYDYQLPFGHGRRFLSGLPGWANHILGGWRMSGVLALQSGLPFTPTITGDRANIGVGGQRPDLIGTPFQPRNVSCWYFTSANSTCSALYAGRQDWWALPPAPTDPATPQTNRYGTGGRNILRADGLKNMDFGLAKSSKLTESKSLEFRAEFFNLTNHPTFSAPSGSVNSGSGGQVGSTLDPARQIEFALKFYF